MVNDLCFDVIWPYTIKIWTNIKARIFQLLSERIVLWSRRFIYHTRNLHMYMNSSLFARIQMRRTFYMETTYIIYL